MKNKDIHTALHLSGIKKYELAEALGISEPTLYRWMRHEVVGEKHERILTAIKKLIEEKEDGK